MILTVLTLFTFALLVAILKPSPILDSTSGDTMNAFRNNPCFTTTEEQENLFLSLTQLPDYKRWVRPGGDDGPLRLNVSLDMNSLASVDDIQSEYSLLLMMDLEWFDNRLVFKDHIDGCKQENAMTMEGNTWHFERIWYPTLRVPNTKEPGSMQLNGDASVVILRIKSDGYMFLRLKLQLKLFCQLNFEEYPFDTQQCSVKIESRSLSDEQLILSWHDVHPFYHGEGFHMAGYRLINYELSNDSVKIIGDLYETDRVSRIKVQFHLQREWYHYLLDVYLPSALFVIMSWLSFWLEISATPARITLGMTTMLTLVTSSTSAREKLPKVSYIHALDIWIAVCICFVFASLIEFAIVSYIFRAEKSRQQRVKSMQRDLSALSLATLASSSEPVINVSEYLDVPKPKYAIIGCNSTNEFLTIDKLADRLRRVSCQEINGTDDIKLRKKRRFWKMLTFKKPDIKNLFKLSNPQQFADSIDRKSRFVFPLCFLIFNIVYWISKIKITK